MKNHIISAILIGAVVPQQINAMMRIAHRAPIVVTRAFAALGTQSNFQTFIKRQSTSQTPEPIDEQEVKDFHAAISGRQFDTVKQMVEANKKLVNSQWHSTPLHAARLWDRDDMVEYLVEQGADVNALGDRNEPVIFKYLDGSYANPRMVNFLLSKGASPIASFNEKGLSAYIRALNHCKQPGTPWFREDGKNYIQILKTMQRFMKQEEIDREHYNYHFLKACDDYRFEHEELGVKTFSGHDAPAFGFETVSRILKREFIPMTDGISQEIVYIAAQKAFLAGDKRLTNYIDNAAQEFADKYKAQQRKLNLSHDLANFWAFLKESNMGARSGRGRK